MSDDPQEILALAQVLKTARQQWEGDSSDIFVAAFLLQMMRFNEALEVMAIMMQNIANNPPQQFVEPL